MRNYTVQYSQSIFDIAIETYGRIDAVWELIDDNALVDGLDTDLEGGQILVIKDGTTFSANTITEYFNRYPAIINNSDYVDTGIVETLSLVLKAIGNEKHGGDGFILIDVLGGTPDYAFVWTNQDTGAIVSTSQNLVASPSGTYSVIVVDANGNEAALTNLTISVTDNTEYLIDDFGNYVTDEFGNYIIVNN